ncbi:unnamed protein product [Schistosoma mattheei]|uniref:Uncharacterized protein n=1 Tax=Schistosoma mattheei TaxID=31246 RepID=A0A183PCI0_9TREM|nr:unnamed protein product [Schistosoma mattheei]
MFYIILGEQHHNHQQFKHEYHKEPIKTIKSPRSIHEKHDSNNSNLKLHKISKFHFHSFSILPVSMLPKLHQNIHQIESSNSITDLITKHNSLNNDYSKVIENQNIEQSLTNQIIHCSSSSSSSMSSTPLITICSSPGSDQMNKDRVAPTPKLMIGSEVVERIDRFTYLGSLISPCGLVCEEISSRIQKARLAFSNLRHLWRRRDIRLSTKRRVYCAAVRSVLL